MNIKTAIKYLVQNKDLSEKEAQEVMFEIMTDKVTPAQFGSFITALKIKGETAFEIAGMANAMRSVSLKIDLNQSLLDTCGTGGSGLNWFNISTACAFVISGAGIKIAKHGNKAISGKSGSADVLSELGVNISLKPEQVKRCIEDIGIGFLFAQTFHPAMKFAGPLRPQIGIPTIFNFLGPLTNPANASNQVLGVSNINFVEKIAKGRYNDIYFADDAPQNVKAVQKVIDNLNLKGRSVQARFSKEKDLNKEINAMIEYSKGIGKDLTYTPTKGRLAGKGKRGTGFYLPSRAEDFNGLVRPFLGKG